MTGRPELLFRHASGPKKVSVILSDWSARESFHSIEYLNRQTAPRDSYELIWVEFYERRAEAIRRMIDASNRPMVDQWLVLGYPPDSIYHKHRAYNAGILAARGEICVICDSDAMFRPTFIESLLAAFDETAYAAIHVDMVRNLDGRFHPFNHPPFEDVIGPGCVNWVDDTTMGLWSDEDRLHRVDYTACLAAQRRDLLAIGGADEHHDYLGTCAGPYEMTFRLLNRGRRERWLTNEYLFQTPRLDPNALQREYSGPHDGRHVSLRALHARATGRTRPYVENPCLSVGPSDERFAAFLRYIAENPEPAWHSGQCPPSSDEFAYLVDMGFRGYDLYVFRDEWYAVPSGEAFDAGRLDVLWDEDEDSIRLQVMGLTPDHPGKPRPGRVRRFVQNLLAEPLHCLPRRALRVAGRVLKKRRKKAPA